MQYISIRHSCIDYTALHTSLVIVPGLMYAAGSCDRDRYTMRTVYERIAMSMDALDGMSRHDYVMFLDNMLLEM